MFRRLLIANRGEIACRIARTAKRMGIRTIAVYSEADAGARHVREADEAILIGPAEAAQSYLSIERIIGAAKRTNAEAIHPGYGFLSENEDFAAACTAAGIVFVGPPASAIHAMSSKSEAKALMEKAGVPLVPGYHGADQSPELLAREATRIGYPVLIKPSAGGGGKGMYVVTRAEDFAIELASAKRVAKSAFGDDRVLIEKYLTCPRHIEVQVFADTHGNFVHLFTRDCSVQRRHQKVIEEAPAPGLSAERTREMGKAAIAAARAVNYVGAGTIEFIAEGDNFFFMEMNTRLQVEHPVTEMVIQQDLVGWQLSVAAGEPLPLRQDQIMAHGHAFEARVYAEDPRRDFLPTTGRLIHVDLRERLGLRIDSGVAEGNNVSPHYDPMLAKLITWGVSREAALEHLVDGLSESAIVGVANNIDFLERIARHPEFAAGPVDTGFIARHMSELCPAPSPADDTTLALAVLSILADRKRRISQDDPHSPWAIADGWQINGAAAETIQLRDGDNTVPVSIGYRRDGRYALNLPGNAVIAKATRGGHAMLHATINGRVISARVVRHGDAIHVFGTQGEIILRPIDPLAGSGAGAEADGHLTAPMPGLVVAVAVKAGETVARGARLMVIEAMKMEHAIVAPADGTVAKVRFAVGDKVREGEELIEFTRAEAAQ